MLRSNIYAFLKIETLLIIAKKNAYFSFNLMDVYSVQEYHFYICNWYNAECNYAALILKSHLLETCMIYLSDRSHINFA